MTVDIEKEIKDNFGFIKNQCNMRAGKNSDNLLSVVLEKIWKYRNNFDGANFRGWIVQVVKNSNIEITTRSLDSKYHFYEINDKFGLKSHLNPSFNDEQFIEVISEIVKNNFNSRYHKIFILRFIDGYKFYEIAKIIGMKEANTKLVIHKIRKFLIGNKKLIDIWKEN